MLRASTVKAKVCFRWGETPRYSERQEAAVQRFENCPQAMVVDYVRVYRKKE